MAISDAYATAVEYRSRVGKTDSGDDTTVIDPLLKAVSRLLDRECGRHFTKDAAAVARLFDGNGCAKLYVDDIASTTGLVVKVDLNEDFDYADADETLVRDTHYWVGPANAALEAEARPWQWLELVPNNSVLSIWPAQKRALEVTAIFGWPAVPGAVKEATIMVAREIRDLELSGMTLDLQNSDQVLQLAPQAFSIVQRIKAEYGKLAMIS